jgi:hypothetical protein
VPKTERARKQSAERGNMRGENMNEISGASARGKR